MSDDLNPETRRLVDLARQARSPADSDKLRIAERLAVPLAAGAAAGSAAATAKATGGAVAATKAVTVGITAKLAAVVALGAVASAIIVGQTDSKHVPAAAPQQQQPQAQPAPVTAAPEPPAIAPEALAPAAEEPAAPHKSAGPSGAASARPADALAEEAALLHQAQAAWRAGQSAQALALASQHAQRFPRSQLANERDVLRVLSLCKLGQTQAAKQVGARLLKKAKGSPWYQSVAESCAGE